MDNTITPWGRWPNSIVEVGDYRWAPIWPLPLGLAVNTVGYDVLLWLLFLVYLAATCLGKKGLRIERRQLTQTKWGVRIACSRSLQIVL